MFAPELYKNSKKIECGHHTIIPCLSRLYTKTKINLKQLIDYINKILAVNALKSRFIENTSSYCIFALLKWCRESKIGYVYKVR